MYEAADEPAFQKIIRNLCEFAEGSDKFLVALPKLNDVVNEDLNVWIETYITDIPYKKNKILTECLRELDDEFSMQEAEEKMYEFINRINSRDPDVIKILN
jgi:hypothetical protein